MIVLPKTGEGERGLLGAIARSISFFKTMATPSSSQVEGSSRAKRACCTMPGRITGPCATYALHTAWDGVWRSGPPTRIAFAGTRGCSADAGRRRVHESSHPRLKMITVMITCSRKFTDTSHLVDHSTGMFSEIRCMRITDSQLRCVISVLQNCSRRRQKPGMIGTVPPTYSHEIGSNWDQS